MLSVTEISAYLIIIIIIIIIITASSRVVRHHALNDCISRAFGAASIPMQKEPAGLVQKDGKRPDDYALIPWRVGRPLAWDVTACCAPQ